MNHLIKVWFEYTVEFLPTARSRKVRVGKKRSFFCYPLLEVDESEFKKLSLFLFMTVVMKVE